MTVSGWDGWTENNGGEKQIKVEEQRHRQRVLQTQRSHFLLISHFLPYMLSSKAQGEMWLKLEFPFAGEAEKQESQGRG